MEHEFKDVLQLWEPREIDDNTRNWVDVTQDRAYWIAHVNSELNLIIAGDAFLLALWLMVLKSLSEGTDLREMVISDSILF